MPIDKASQNWTIGQTAKIGFLSLRVTGLIPTPGDHRPDKYTLESPKGRKIHLYPIPWPGGHSGRKEGIKTMEDQTQNLTWKDIESTLSTPEALEKINGQEEEAFLFLDLILTHKPQGGPDHGNNQ